RTAARAAVRAPEGGCPCSRPVPSRFLPRADEAHARSVEATAFLSYDDVSDVLGVRISRGGEPGRINARAGMPLAGDVTLSAAASAAAGNRIAFTDVRPVRGELLASPTALLNKALEEPVPLENVPAGLRLRSVTPTRDGVEADFTGRSVTFRPGSAVTA
ncbi:LmeA family phospholipid-binding protein, partial [Streptomyces sp. NPDC002838]|uniref:LmeA family phospholipid-binding protein n=1 Tax=Streptomyces sp. NPDC002838 TaxID=3154436 RepID=UPI00332C552B